MQTNPKEILRQQIVLNFLGFYNGRLDGIWGPETIAAKKSFEGSGNFNPGIPNSGLPFANDGPLPDGLYMSRGLLQLADQEDQVLLKEAAVLQQQTEQPSVILPGEE